MKKYYLNNFTNKAITISLSTKRTIKAFSSLSLNNKDVQIYKNLKTKRAGKPSLLDGLALSTIKIEDDARYTAFKEEAKAEKVANKKEENNKKAEEKAKKDLEKQAKKEAEEAAKKEAEEAAKKELEEQVKKETEEKEEI